ncbi:expressed unknown protein [Seminavis robusta]|uniref:PDZ domain-containing protein n=1 Tax=Seminavis robusta TaxID=568900 RepID=A0A9N8HPF4_9STRA|nr:expressed unknown protein [Seminavis robusta]|eukprot:Sro1083_g239330.1 n/a (279) ;mRNA; r:11093-12044
MLYPLQSFALLLVALLEAPTVVVGFTLSPTTPPRAGKHIVALNAEESSSSKLELVVNEEFKTQELFPMAEFEDFSLLPHRPLGMRIEESLADSKLVFVTRVEDGGLAEKAGIRVGDVLVGVTGLFGDMTGTVGLGVEKIKGMVASRPEEEPLQIQVARGTGVLDDHEKAVVEICSNESSDQEIEQCVVDYLSMEDLETEPAAEEETTDDNDDDDDDIDPLDNLMNMWAEDLPPVPPSQPTEKLPSESAPKVKPWSSRSSPSGTFVRDPVTGEMKNIDA